MFLSNVLAGGTGARITRNMAAPRQDAATVRQLELEIDQLLEEQ